MDSSEEFIEFAAAVAPRLRWTAYLLCGDWHTAQDLTLIALAKVFAAWHRVNSGEGAYAYAHRTLVNCYLAGNRVAQGDSYVFSATVRRADGLSVAVRATNYVPGPNALPPLSMAQVVTAAADPRWSWTMDGSFVAGAEVTLSYEPGFVTVSVGDSGTAAGVGAHGSGTGRGDGTALGSNGAGGGAGARPDSTVRLGPGGFGLAGIAERVASCGGSLTTGPTETGGFAVTARLPAR